MLADEARPAGAVSESADAENPRTGRAHRISGKKTDGAVTAESGKRHIVAAVRKYKHGDVGKDGRIFLSYRKRKLASGETKVYEHWLTKSGFAKWKARGKAYTKRNADKIAKRARDWYYGNWKRARVARDRYAAENKEKLGEARRNWTTNNVERLREWQRKWREENREHYRRMQAAYRKKNRERLNAWMREHYAKNKDRRNAINRKWSNANVEKVRTFRREYAARRYASDAEYKLTRLIRNRIMRVLKGRRKEVKTLELLGCSLNKLKLHIEGGFDERMTWDNHGTYWHVDHIIPLAAFDLTNESELRMACNYRNLQPLEAIANMKKGARGFTTPTKRKAAKARR